MNLFADAFRRRAVMLLCVYRIVVRANATPMNHKFLFKIFNLERAVFDEIAPVSPKAWTKLPPTDDAERRPRVKDFILCFPTVFFD